MTGLTYLQFHGAFLLSALLALAPAVTISRPRAPGPTVRGDAGRRYWGGVAIIVVVALVYTIPWDNYLIARGVWSYGTGRVAARLWLAPVEEYLFVLVQPVLTALWLSHLSIPDWDAGPLRVRPRVLGGAAGVALGLVGALLLTRPGTFYLGAILAWAAPVLVLQWAVGAPQLWRARRALLVGTLVPTAYLCVADLIAIANGVWTLSSQYTTGIELLGLPVEEATFFLVTNLFVVQGLILYRWVIDRWA